VKERLASEHRGELLGNALEHFLDGSGVTDESGRHLESLRRDVAHGGLDVVRDPLNKVRRVLVLHVKHLLVDFLGGHAATEHARSGEVTSVTRVSGAHHVLGVELLLGQFRDGQGTVLLGPTGGQRSESNHEEVKTRERDKVHSELAEVGVELTGETEARGHAGHGSRHEVVAKSF